MIFKKFCTIHAMEFTGEICPECEKAVAGTGIRTKTVSAGKNPEKPEKKKKHKKKKPAERETGGDYDIKLKELIEKYS